MEKKNYLKPTIEIVEVQLSDCIAGSTGVSVGVSKTAHYEMGLSGGWSSEVESLNK